MQVRALLLIFILSCAQAKHKNKTAAIEAAEDAVNEVVKFCNSSRNEKTADAIEEDLDAAAVRINSHFTSQRSELEEKFSNEAHKIISGTSDPNQVANLSMSPLQEISSKLDELDAHQRHALSEALDDITKEARKNVSKALKHSKRAAHDAIHPLYGLGDEAEEHADKLNDALTDAANCAGHGNRKVEKRIGDHAKNISHEEKKMFEGAAHSRHVQMKEVETKLSDAKEPDAAIIELAVKPTRDSPVAQASGVSLAWITIFVSFLVGATVASGIVKFSPSESGQSATTPLLHL